MADYTSIIPYLIKSEGGLTKNPKDSASKNPVPDGSGYHTNKGITWTTWSSEFGTSKDSVKRFYAMAPNDWGLLLKKNYWNPMSGDSYNSQAIANAVVDFAWASGVGGATKSLNKYMLSKGKKTSTATQIANAFNALVQKEGETKIFNEVIEWRKKFFKSLNQPAFEKGWLARMDDLASRGLSLIVDEAKKKPLLTAIAIIAVTISIIVIVKNIKNNGR